MAGNHAGGWPASTKVGGAAELLPPGVVHVHTWRPGPGDIVPPDGNSAHGGFARKP